MLPQFYRDRYQEFFTAVVHLQQTVADDNPNPTLLRQSCEQLQLLFQQQILSLDSDNLDPSVMSRVQSFLTELNKQMRLLSIDVTFLQASRQSATTQQRLAQIRSRIETLISYCNALLDNDSASVMGNGVPRQSHGNEVMGTKNYQ
ncbi:heterocyst frequency control protein PatD [Microseira sp. BLCC-F43]|jgi:ABC-type transporter Mla subunit MlaD|uniref:heterocyst frequency control protein PatD n=1 Tax=Microseira sp. BLCC-F43 TaxID=3153602 RepID=UPI0035B9044D